MPQRRAAEDSRPAATSGHTNSSTRFTAASPRQRLAELRVAPRNHTDAFTARRGAPRKHLYRDQLHPSDGGTSRLVFNLQLATGARRRQAHHHLPSSRPQQRQDPAQPQQRQEGIKQHHAAFAVGTCATRFCPLCTKSLACLLELPSVAENNSTAAV